ncbi:ATP-binding cassette domain-containing protein [Enterobacter sp. CC120223-11]|uniref:ATP-binding cassette domain-containing protein n=1 Tax=Enterobacter sp. CC120223-11 TaxID=1378073 RepID=UPI000BC7CA51|nr:ATP-binding cassette domain-containing protein [Enterobacter sp. CC120223-11]SNY59669.1 putative thiamine transport system ATP-binding protein [Enterobacter sp. CC120223-11]
MLKVDNLTLRLTHETLLSDVSFQADNGETLTLMGASGSGKSTLLGWMVGASESNLHARGELWLNDRRCDTLPTEARRIGILFQDALLFDHFSVGQNLLLALPGAVPGGLRRQKAEAALEQAGLGGFYARDPATLSGGQRARVALLRSLLAEPEALLLDEPFSGLDAVLRDSFRQWVFAEIKRRQIPVILVTHDVADIPPEGRCLRLESWR